MFTRVVNHRYVDPLDAIWIACAEAAGLSIQRGQNAYASTDGHGELLLSDAAGMDADDCLAQMILHEFCHALVQGPESFDWPDWGLENETGEDAPLEHACLRVQAALLAPLGLRQVLAPTTDYRAFYDELPEDPLVERKPEERESIIRARLALGRVSKPPYGPHLQTALEATATLVAAVQAGLAALQNSGATNLLYSRAEPRYGKHRLGSPLAPGERTCGECAWARPNEKRSKLQCVRHGKSVQPSEPACIGQEIALNCQACGACCREAYDVVLIGRKDPALRKSLPQIEKTRGGGELPRPDGRCVALRGGKLLPPIQPFLSGGPGTKPENKPRYVPDESGFSCVIYDERPKTCRDFTLGSRNCLEARTKVGLTRLLD